jgi:hypothetical protein
MVHAPECDLERDLHADGRCRSRATRSGRGDSSLPPGHRG